MKTRITHFAAPAERRNGRRGRLLDDADLLPATTTQSTRQNRNDFSSPVAESSAADRLRAPAALGERESVNGYLQRLYRQRAQPLRDVHSGGVPACVWHAVGSNSQSPIPSRFCGPCNARRELPVRPLPALEIAQGRLGTTPKQTRTTRASKRQNLRRGGTT